MKKKSITLNFIMNAILTMSSFIFPLITFPYVSRVLGPVGTGKVSFATSIISYFAMFAQLGIPTYGIRACAKVRDNKEELSRTVQELVIINGIMSVLTYIVFFAALFFVPKMAQDKTLFLICSSTIFFNLIGMEWLYKGLEQYSYITIRSIIFKLLALILMFVFVKQEQDYVIYGAITIVAAVGSNIFNLINVHRYVSLKPVGGYHLKKHLKAVSIFLAMSVATTVYTHLDTAMLGFMKSDEEVGYYNAAVRIKTILVSLVTSLGTVLLPRASYYMQNGLKEEFLKISKKALNFVWVVAPPMMLYLMLFAQEGIYFLSGDQYANSILPMQIIMPTLLFIGLTNIMGIQMLVPMGREKTVLYSEIAGAIVDLVLNAILIPKMGAAGAAIGTLVAEFVVLLYQYIALKDTVKDAYKSVQYWKLTLGLGLGCVASIWVKALSFGFNSIEMENFVKLVLSACTFFGVYVVVLLITGEPFIRLIMDSVLNKLKRKK